MIRRTWRLGAAALATGAVLAAGVTPAVASPKVAALKAHAAASTPYTIYLSNNFVGNDWRVQMEKEATVAADAGAVQGEGQAHHHQCPNTVPAQISSLQAIVARKPDAILIDAGSPTALNPVISQACKAGHRRRQLRPGGNRPLRLQDLLELLAGEQQSAKWLASVLHGKGSVFEDTGSGRGADQRHHLRAWATVLKNYPNIKVVGTYQGQYALGPEQAGRGQLAGRPSERQRHPDPGLLHRRHKGAAGRGQAVGPHAVPGLQPDVRGPRH